MDHVLAIARPIVVLAIPVTFWILVFYFLFHNRRKKAKRIISKPAPATSQKEEMVHTEVHRRPELKCQCCDGHYVYREGPYGSFASCSNFRSHGCKSTLTIEEFIGRLILTYGVNIYAWDTKCERCGAPMKFYTYDLTYDLWEVIPRVEFADLRIGSIPKLDHRLCQEYPDNISKSTPDIATGAYIKNICPYCRTGNPYPASLPEEIKDSFRNQQAERYLLVKNIAVKENSIINAIIDAIKAAIEYWSHK